MDHVYRQPSLGVFAPVMQDEGDGIREILRALIHSVTLAVRAGNFGALPDVPFPIALDYGGELIMK